MEVRYKHQKRGLGKQSHGQWAEGKQRWVTCMRGFEDGQRRKIWEEGNREKERQR